jgi:hypothetical protein
MNTHRVSHVAALVLLLAFSAATNAAVSFSVTVAPPALPVYVQPPVPGDGYIWTPGYWAWGDGAYFWVPGAWVLPPEPGLLWTPGYWGWEDARFVFHEGYWAPHVGFYGGINYGFGYGGVGFEGGYWRSGRFFYNRAITNVNEVNVRNVYTKTVIHNTTNVVSFNGGNGGTTARPTAMELRAANERHVPPVAAQREHIRQARNNPELRSQSKLAAASPARHDEMQARQQRERRELQDRQAAEREEMERQHPNDERRQALAATHAREQQELARRHKQEEDEMEPQHR